MSYNADVKADSGDRVVDRMTVEHVKNIEAERDRERQARMAAERRVIDLERRCRALEGQLSRLVIEANYPAAAA